MRTVNLVDVLWVASLTHDTLQEPQEAFLHDQAHVAMTYTALCILLILGDDLSRVNKQAITAGLRALQMPDGRYVSFPEPVQHNATNQD
jgi:geranylgeranyl transferase type-1 subunit beta